MATKSYYAARDLEIQSVPIRRGQVIGTGDVTRGSFSAAEGLERVVELGHVLPRLLDGRITDRQPAADAPEPPEPPAPRPAARGKTKTGGKAKSGDGPAEKPTDA